MPCSYFVYTKKRSKGICLIGIGISSFTPDVFSFIIVPVYYADGLLHIWGGTMYEGILPDEGGISPVRCEQ